MLATVAMWAEPESQVYFRILGALAALDVLLVALQPVLALARPRSEGSTTCALASSAARSSKRMSRLPISPLQLPA